MFKCKIEHMLAQSNLIYSQIFADPQRHFSSLNTTGAHFGLFFSSGTGSLYTLEHLPVRRTKHTEAPCSLCIRLQ